MLPHQTSGSYFTIKTSLPNAGKDYPVDLPPALHSLGRFYCTRKPYEPDCFYLRWENVGDLSGVETLLLEQSDVLGEMTGSRRKGQMRVTWGKRGVLTMQSILVILLSATQEKQTRMERALSASALHTSSHRLNDVRLHFPRQGKELWTSSALLSAKSPYFEALLSSSFSEGRKRTKAPSMVTGSPTEYQDQSGFDDSDDERDEALPKPLPSDSTTTSASCATTFHEVVITSTAFTTYRAVLGWLNTSYIDFAELSSSTSSATQPPADIARANAASSSSNTTSSLLSPPSPASPLSVYRLSHFLSLPDLPSLALSSLASQLTIQNILPHLFSPITAAYPEIADVVVEFAARNWSAIRESEGAREVEREIEGGERRLETGVAWRLMKVFE